MKKIFYFICTLFPLSTAFGQCPSSFSFAVSSETVSFTNQSIVSNAHYFWNFGDGTGSNSINPVHAYPETGKYMVSLFVLDTISNCSSNNDQWISVIKSSTHTCQPVLLKDSTFYNGSPNGISLLLTDSSVNCNNCLRYMEVGANQMQLAPIPLLINGLSARYVGRMNYHAYDSTVFQWINRRGLYKTTLFRYQSSKHYNNCSANFEFIVVSQDAGGQRILFKAMNRTATTYKWYLAQGATSTVMPTTDTVSVYYPFNLFSNKLVIVVLSTTGSPGCKDTLIQTIRIPDMGPTSVGINEYSSVKTSFSIYPNPTHDKIVVTSIVEFEKITLINSLGQEVFVLNKPSRIQEIDISHLPPGIYLTKIENKMEQSSYKIVKE